ncbi:hypothetical protein [uncultured Sunxiuqinia sp.]|uniref:hypothetical protein n=1 Tax=uncultured Sunxiuqinia sp. TaxID=1573825 RepID=UPI00260B9927|nr:hypothetical protein [uncultured Sunxiuqinia sp.]
MEAIISPRESKKVGNEAVNAANEFRKLTNGKKKLPIESKNWAMGASIEAVEGPTWLGDSKIKGFGIFRLKALNG